MVGGYGEGRVCVGGGGVVHGGERDKESGESAAKARSNKSDSYQLIHTQLVTYV